MLSAEPTHLHITPLRLLNHAPAHGSTNASPKRQRKWRIGGSLRVAVDGHDGTRDARARRSLFFIFKVPPPASAAANAAIDNQ